MGQKPNERRQKNNESIFCVFATHGRDVREQIERVMFGICVECGADERHTNSSNSPESVEITIYIFFSSSLLLVLSCYFGNAFKNSVKQSSHCA